MTVQRRTARGATTAPSPGPRRRTPQSHDRVKSRARPGRERRVAETAETGAGHRLLRGATKVLGRVVLGLIILGVFIFGVFPTGSYVEQRNELREAEAELAELQGENAELEARIERLGSDSEIELEAREFGLVLPEEENYLIIAPGN